MVLILHLQYKWFKIVPKLYLTDCQQLFCFCIRQFLTVDRQILIYLFINMRILVSWQALTNDFSNGNVNLEGPNYNFHKYHYLHDKHILLSTSKEHDTGLLNLIHVLNRDFVNHNVEGEYLDVEDPIDLREVKTKVENFLLKYKDDDIDIFFSPGNSIMQVTWYLCHEHLGLNTRLLQTRRWEFSVGKEKPDLLVIDLVKSPVAAGLIIKQSVANRKIDNNTLITKSLKPVYDMATQVAAAHHVPVLITGESGTGKEILAHYIHNQSIRASKPFVAVNCSVFTEQLLESRLFGYKKGSFTGADKDTDGLIFQANGGTLFMDEIGDISPYMQQSLLRVLQEKEICPIGGRPIQINVRFMAATNKDLYRLTQEGKFRLDLYYRLNVVELSLPPLRQYAQDEIMELIDHLNYKKSVVFLRKKPLIFDNQTLEILLQHKYPGNIRELENMMENFYVFCTDMVRTNNLPKHLFMGEEESSPMHQQEKEILVKTLKNLKGNISKTAKHLGISINTVKGKCLRANIDWKMFK